MPGYPILPDESLRLASLYRLNALESSPEAEFDQITALLAHIYNAPIAAIALMDVDRHFTKSCVGIPRMVVPRAETFCTHALVEPEALVVSDATLDPRFAQNPYVSGPPFVRFYAGAPLRSKDGFAIGTVCITDYVARHHFDSKPLLHLAETSAQLLEKHALLKLVSSMRHVLFQMDGAGRFTYLTPAWEEVTGIPIASAVGHHWTEFVLNPPAEFAGTLQFHHDVWLEASSRATIGQPGMTGTLFDITGRKRNEIALQRASSAKSAFVASISHEIRTPLNVILGLAEVLAETELNSEQKRYVDVFQRAGTTLLGLINNVLDLSKLESERVQLEKIDFDLHLLVDQTVQLIRPRLKPGVELVSIAKAPRFVCGDPTRLQQILLNLLSNAVKFTDRGRISVEAVGTTGDVIQFRVVDTGIGIAPSRLQTIFDDFVQADASISRKYGGTGLGLGICNRLARAMGGEIKVDSEVGGGSTFAFTAVLPSVAKMLPQLTAASDSPTITARRVLIADDSEENRAVFEAYLQPTPHRVTFARDGVEAVEASSQFEFDIIFMDVMMPRLDGLSAIRQIRQSGAKTRIVTLTANALTSDIEASRAAGSDDHLTKPVSKRQLLAAIENCPMQNPPSGVPEPAVQKLAPRYLERRRSDILRLRESITALDFSTCKRLGHDMKGTGAAYGFPIISDLGAQIEAAAKDGNGNQVASAVAKLDAFLQVA